MFSLPVTQNTSKMFFGLSNHQGQVECTNKTLKKQPLPLLYAVSRKIKEWINATLHVVQVCPSHNTVNLFELTNLNPKYDIF